MLYLHYLRLKYILNVILKSETSAMFVENVKCRIIIKYFLQILHLSQT